MSHAKNTQPQKSGIVPAAPQAGERPDVSLNPVESASQNDNAFFYLHDNGSISIRNPSSAEAGHDGTPDASRHQKSADAPKDADIDFFLNEDGSVTVTERSVEDETPARPEEQSATPETRPAESGSANGEVASDLDNLIDGVSRLGALGSLYWGDDPGEGKDSGDDAYASMFSLSYLHAHDNLGILTHKDVETDAGYFEPETEVRQDMSIQADESAWNIFGSLQQQWLYGNWRENILTANGSPADTLSGRGFDLESFVNDNTSLQGWSKDKNALASMEREFAVSEDALDPTLEISWSMFANGKQSTLGDVSIAFLFRVGESGALEYVDHQVLNFGILSGVSSGQVSWSVEPGGNYVVPMVVAGKGSDTSAILAVNGMEFISREPATWVDPIDVDKDAHTVSASGNVLADPMAGDGDHHSDGLGFAVTRFCLDGEWFEVSPAPLTWTDDDGACFSFTMEANGEYSLEAAGTDGISPSFGEMNIIYEIQSADGLTDQADLYLRNEEHTFFADSAKNGIITGSGGNDVIHAGDDGLMIYGGAGSDVMYGGKGADIFAWRAEDLDGSLDIIKDFSLADGDKLLFEGLLPETEDLRFLLDSGRLSLENDGDTVRLGLALDSGESVNIDVQMQSGQMDAFINDYMSKNDSTTDLELAQLQLLLNGNG